MLQKNEVILVMSVAALAYGIIPQATAPHTPADLAVSVPTQSRCDIKGNVSYTSGKRIYHVPGQEDYESTRISEARGERWFCSEAEAEAAGWRKASR